MTGTPIEEGLTSRLTELDAERANVKDKLDRERMIRVTAELIKTLTAPEFVARTRSARTTGTPEEAMEATKSLLSIDTMRKAGIDIPDDFRLTSRMFEDKATGFRFEEKLGSIDTQGSHKTAAGKSVCGGAGTGNICVCGGFEW